MLGWVVSPTGLAPASPLKEPLSFRRTGRCSHSDKHVTLTLGSSAGAQSSKRDISLASPKTLAVSHFSSFKPQSASTSTSILTATSATTAEPSVMDTPNFDAANLMLHMRKVFRSGLTRDITWREDQLRRIALMLKEREQEVYDAIEKDLARSPFDSYSEVVLTMKSAEDAAKSVAKWARPKKVGTDMINQPATSEIVSDPYGVVLIVAPWNVPFSLALEPLIGAIAAGNAAVIKPSELSPACSGLLARLVEQYLDTSAIRVVQGGPQVAVSLLDQKWDKIFFTGGTEIGRKVAMAAAKHLTPVTLELGGKNPGYFDRSADLVTTCKRMVWGSFLNTGQVCLKPEYILVEEDMAGKLVEQIKKTMEEFYGSDPSQSQDIGRIISERHAERLGTLLSDPRVKDCIVVGGKWDISSRYVAPTVLRDVPWDTPIMEQETFGPILAIQTVKSLDEAISIVNDRPKPLASYIFSTTEATIQKIISETSSGAIVVNETVTHFLNPYLPFGGVGDSGTGAYHGKFSFDCFSHQKSVLKKATFGDVPFRYPPSTPIRRRLMRALMDLDFLSIILLLIGLRK